jgi:hypothetical protein
VTGAAAAVEEEPEAPAAAGCEARASSAAMLA